MRKYWWLIPVFVFTLSGCSFSGSSPSKDTPAPVPVNGAVFKSVNGGASFEPKITIDAKTNLKDAETLSLTFDAANSQHIYIGTKAHGIFETMDGGEQWKKLEYPPIKVYGLVSEAENPRHLYATGVWQGRGTIYRSEDGGATWKEIYTEPSDGTIVTALAQSAGNPAVLYAGTSSGLIIKTADRGNSWQNIQTAETGGGTLPAITSIVFDSGDTATVYFVLLNQGILRTRDDGMTFTRIEAMGGQDTPTPGTSVTSITTDQGFSGVLYVGTASSGIFRSLNFGDQWESVNVIESSKKFPVRTMAVNPRNSQEIFYTAALALYKSVDGGAHWSTYQLDTDKTVGLIRYDPTNPAVLYLGMRSF